MDRHERDWAMGCHLAAFAGYVIPLGWIIGPLVVWLLKREDLPFVDYHGKESLNFHISILIYLVISGILCLLIIGFLLLAVVLILQIVFTIIAAVQASKGEYYRYPLTIRFIK